uniref:M-phase phosphoprotein 8 n=1 Tax=Hippocampus comes TaxID=109280 RepID=A0A3Q3DKQ0_HIPCM
MDSELQKMEPVDSEQDEEENVYEVERIIDMRVEEGEVLYRVRWKGYCSDDDTWEPEGHLEDCREVLLAYKKATIEIKKEPEDRKPILPLPIKSDVFDADSESDSDKDQPANDTAVIKKKKKKKKFRELEDEEEETPRKEKKKKKKKDKWRDEVKPLPAPETDEDDEEKTAETKKHVIKSENEDEAPPKKPKKEMTKDGKLRKDRGGEEPKKKKTRREYSIASSDEDLSEGLSDSSAKKEKPQLDEHRSKPKQKLDGKLKGTKDPMQDKKSKLKESSLLKLKSLTASKIREDAGPPSSDSSDSSSLHRKGKSKSQEAKAAAKPREDEAAREDGKGSTNLFETFLQSCAAKDRAPRRLPADKSASKPSKVLGKIEKIKPVKESPTLKEPERMEKSKQPEAVPRPGQGYGFSLDSDELEGENASSKPRTGDYSRERREKPEESQTRPGWEPKGPPEDRKKKREDGEPRPLAASDDHADQQPTEPTDKSVFPLTLINMENTRRKAYDAAFKLEAITLAVKEGNRAAARNLGIDESMVRKWRLQQEELSQCEKTTKAFRGNHSRWPELENFLEDWVHSQRAGGRSVSTVQIRRKAKTIATEMNIEGFKGGPSWCFRFMKRKSLSIRPRKTLCQQLPPNYEDKLASFRTFTQTKIAENSISPDEIIIMDEVPLTFDLPLTWTVNQKGDSSVILKTGGHERTHFTCVLSCAASGLKLPPMIIFKRLTMPKEKFPKEIVVKVDHKGWMSESLMKEWLTECYSKRPGGFFHRKKALLIMDSMRAHITDSVKAAIKSTNSIPAVIPGGTTKYLQPLDISVNRAFKVALRQEWETWLTAGEKSFTKTGHTRKASLTQVCQWILRAWSRVKTSTITNGFRKAGLLREEEDAAHSSDIKREETVGPLGDEILRLFNSDTELEDFDGFSAQENDEGDE